MSASQASSAVRERMSASRASAAVAAAAAFAPTGMATAAAAFAAAAPASSKTASRRDTRGVRAPCWPRAHALGVCAVQTNSPDGEAAGVAKADDVIGAVVLRRARLGTGESAGGGWRSGLVSLRFTSNSRMVDMTRVMTLYLVKGKSGNVSPSRLERLGEVAHSDLVIRVGANIDLDWE
jgi:hypothetical protein